MASMTERMIGAARLDVRTYEGKCATCIWGCRMPVEMIIDRWNLGFPRFFGRFA